MKAYWKTYVAPAVLAIMAASIYVWPINKDTKAPVKAERYAGPEHQIRRAGASSETPVLQIALVDIDQPVEATIARPTLVGISGRTVWLKAATSGEVERAGVGDEVEGWTVTSVSPRRVVIKSGSRTEALELF